MDYFRGLHFEFKQIMRDTQIFDLIEQERKRQQGGIELIASENFVSEQVMEAMGSVLTNKYAEGLPFKRYYGGCEVVDQVEQLAIDRLKELFGATWANVQPHSGAQANAAVMLACLDAGDKILGFDLSHGGHLTHGSPVNFSGKLYQTSFYGVDPETGLIDYDHLEEVARREKPKMIIAGASAYSRDWDYELIRNIADDIDALVLADIAHPAGMIATGLLSDAVAHCHIVTSTTHKTLRGPRGGVIMMGNDFENKRGITLKNGNLRMMSSMLDSGVFPGTQGGPLEHVIAAKAIAFGEALSPSYKDYMIQTQRNATALASSLVEMDYKIISGGTDNHSMLIDLRNKSVSGKQAEQALVSADITVNKNMVPFDERSPFITSGMRLGTAAITTRGLEPEHMTQIAHWIDRVVQDTESKAVIEAVRSEVHDLMRGRPLFA